MPCSTLALKSSIMPVSSTSRHSASLLASPSYSSFLNDGYYTGSYYSSRRSSPHIQVSDLISRYSSTSSRSSLSTLATAALARANAVTASDLRLSLDRVSSTTQPSYSIYDTAELTRSYSPAHYVAGTLSRREEKAAITASPPKKAVGTIRRIPGTRWQSAESAPARISNEYEPYYPGSSKVSHLKNDQSLSLYGSTPESQIVRRISSDQTFATESVGLNGLVNFGNICFLNSVVQCLSNIPPLRNYLIEETYKNDIQPGKKGGLITVFADLVKDLWSGSGRDINPRLFKEAVDRFTKSFKQYDQHDAQEFLMFLLQGLHDDISRPCHSTANCKVDGLSEELKALTAWKNYINNNSSKIVDVFVGQLKSTLKCLLCGHTSTTYEPFWDLSIQLAKKISGSDILLSHCLESFTKEEVLEGNNMPMCSKCKTLRQSTKKLVVHRCPKILVIHLKRFSGINSRSKKEQAMVNFPIENLDMSSFAVMPQACKYSLCAVSNHVGSPESGHYTSNCFNSVTKKWYNYNDRRVDPIGKEKVVTAQAYVLFYQLKGC